MLRKLGRLEEGERTARLNQAADPLDFWAANELHLTASARGFDKESAEHAAGLKLKMRGAAESYLELAADYAGCGFYDEAAAVLTRLVKDKPAGASQPMIYYDLAYYHHQSKNDPEARRLLQEALKVSPDYGFPFRVEDIAVLKWAEAENPQDARAPYYLGNLLFDRQPEAAMREWERAVSLDEVFATASRNLGIAHSRVKNDLPSAVACLEKAVACDPADARLFLELDELYDLSDVPPRRRLDLLLGNHEAVAGRDDTLSREIVLLVELGHFDRALELLLGHHFHVWEGGGAIDGVYVDACLGRGELRLAEGKPAQALLDFQAALRYPENLEAGQPAAGAREPEIQYFIGLALEDLGRSGEAQEAFRLSAENPGPQPELAYHQGLSWRKIGRESRARDSFESLVRYARAGLNKAPARDFFAKFGERESAKRREA